ncbi:MAG TPA: hypothetical protein VKS21_02895, partial [Spirochaetota bacterium]|nr:hypothetical protein [Spirochaetota bacterium]
MKIKLQNKKTILWLLLIFLLGLLLNIYFFLHNINHPSEFTAILQKEKKSYAREVNNAVTFIKNRQYALAADILDEITGAVHKKKQLYTIYLLKAQCNKNMGLFRTALKNTGKALTIKKTAFAYFLQGTVYEKIDKQKAMQAYIKAIKTDPEYYYAYEKCGDLHYGKNNFTKALQFYKPEKFKKYYTYDSSLIKIALSFYFLNDYQKSLKYCNKYLEFSLKHLYTETAYFLLALNHAALGASFKETSSYFHK